MTQAPEQQYYATLPQQSFQMYPQSRHHQFYFQPQMEISGQPDIHNSLTFIPHALDPQTSYYHSMDPELGRYPPAMASNSRTFLPDN